MKQIYIRASALVLIVGAVCAPAFAASNPMDALGQAHNLYLACIETSGDPADSPLRRVVEKCGYEPGMSVDDYVARYEAVIKTDPQLTVAERLMPYRSNYTPYQFSFFTRIDDILGSARDGAEADSRLARLEAEAIGALSTKNDGDRSVLTALSTSRHSLAYWSAAIPDDPKGQMVALKWPKWVRALIVVGADVGGVVLAGPAGGAAGSSMAGSVLNQLDP